jgi:outer membrane biosynthesis protein TonB
MAMTRMARTIVIATLLALPLGACASLEDAADPSNWFGDDFFGLVPKKKLPGERKEVFPQGVPGIERGVPPDLVKGHQAQPDLAGDQGFPGAQQAAVEEEPKPPPKPKAKPKPKPKPATVAVEPRRATPVTVRRAPSEQPAAGAGDAQWPDPPRGASQGGARGAGATQWPDPPTRGASSGGTSPGGVQWPDPPPTR